MIAAARTILRKDLLIELRTKESVPAMVLFSITVYVLFHFGLDRDSLDGELASGVLWVTLLLAAVIGVSRLFAAGLRELLATVRGEHPAACAQRRGNHQREAGDELSLRPEAAGAAIAFGALPRARIVAAPVREGLRLR